MDALIITRDIEVLREGSAAEEGIREYESLGAHVMVFVLHTKKTAAISRRLGTRLWIVPVYGLVMPLVLYRALRIVKHELYFQRKLQVELIEAKDSLWCALLAWLIARRYRRPLYLNRQEFTPSDSPFGIFVSLFRAPIRQFLLARADSITTDTEEYRTQLIANNTWKDRVFTLPRVLDLAKLKQQGGGSVDLRATYPQYKIIFLTVAPLTAESNLELAIQVIAGVVRSYAFAGLVMVGEGREKSRLQALAKKLGVEKHVVFEGWTTDLSSYYRGAHIFLMTATSEAYGNTIVEAAAASCAILSADVGMAHLILKNEESAFLCDPKDPTSFVKIALTLVNNPQLREKVRLNAMLAVEGYVAQQKNPVTRIETIQKAWQAAKVHFDAVQKHVLSAPMSMATQKQALK